MIQNPDTYIKDRLDQYSNWYDRKSVMMKNRYLNGRIFSAAGAVLVPVVTNIDWTLRVTESLTLDISKIITTLLSTTVALFIALEGVLHYREQWKNYRTTEQYLTTQKNLYLNGVGDYSKLTDEEAFKLLVKRVETAIIEENAVTLNVLTKVDSGEQKTG